MGVLKILPIVAVSLALLPGCDKGSDNSNSSGAASDTSAQSSGKGAGGPRDNAGAYAPDNTGLNQRDHNAPQNLTSEDQGGSDADREITRQIRRSITSNSQLSSAAGNIKIITQNGKVTLRGPVDSPAEQQSLADLAKGTPGVTGVDNQLEVKSKQ